MKCQVNFNGWAHINSETSVQAIKKLESQIQNSNLNILECLYSFDELANQINFSGIAIVGDVETPENSNRIVQNELSKIPEIMVLICESSELTNQDLEYIRRFY